MPNLTVAERERRESALAEGESLAPVEVVDRSAVLDFIRSLGLTPTEVTKLTITAASVTVERRIPLGPLEVDITDACPAIACGRVSREAVRADIATCTLCDGEGYTDDNEDEYERSPWSFWLSLPPGSNMALHLGLVHKVPCVRCSR